MTELSQVAADCVKESLLPFLFLAGWGIAFGDTVLEGDLSFGTQELAFSSGAPLVRFPPDGLLVAGNLKDQGEEVLGGSSTKTGDQFPILGLYQVPPSQLHYSASLDWIVF
jgi:hypothetical protein